MQGFRVLGFRGLGVGSPCFPPIEQPEAEHRRVRPRGPWSGKYADSVARGSEEVCLHVNPSLTSKNLPKWTQEPMERKVRGQRSSWIRRSFSPCKPFADTKKPPKMDPENLSADRSWNLFPLRKKHPKKDKKTSQNAP